MWQKILGYGVVAGLIAGVPLSVIVIALEGHTPLAWGMVIGYVTMLIALSTVFVAIKRYRDTELGGVIGFWPALGLGIGISVVAGILYALCWEAAIGITHMDFATTYANTLIDQKKAAGVTGEALAQLTAEMERFKVQYANPLYRLPMTFTEIFPVGVLVSLVSAGLLRNRRFLASGR
ncbi:MAG TPA: DUF4199 domain-containing protein [Rhodanobacteraceae bacterium]